MDNYSVNRRLLALAGASVGDPDVRELAGVFCAVGALVVLSPLFGTSLENMKRRVAGGKDANGRQFRPHHARKVNSAAAAAAATAKIASPTVCL
jgi:hypothetical protein